MAFNIWLHYLLSSYICSSITIFVFVFVLYKTIVGSKMSYIYQIVVLSIVASLGVII
jgi:hypothetical protein